MRTFPARPPTWLDRWAASGGHARRLNRREAWFAARWAYRHGYGLYHDETGLWRLAKQPVRWLDVGF